MARPVIAKPASEHLLTLTRMLQSVEVDPSLEVGRKHQLRVRISALMQEWQQIAVHSTTLEL